MDKFKLTDRKPAVAGSFYPDDANQLFDELDNLLKSSKQIIHNKKVRALIVPHAGYIFSGKVAASGYNQISSKKYKNIFLIGSSHQMRFDGISVFNSGNYITPLGKVKVNFELADRLIELPHFHSYDQAHMAEHSLEVQLPFLQKIFDDFTIVPMIVGTDSLHNIREISSSLNTYFTPENLFIISTDFSHYPAYDDAIRIDRITAESIILNDPEHFIETIAANADLSIKNLATSICGWTSVLLLLHLTKNNISFKYDIIDYMNSGDQPDFADKSRVVGYYSMMVTQ